MNYYQSKDDKQSYKIKELLCKTIEKCRFKTPRRALGIEVVLCNSTREMGMDNFSCLNSSYFYFVTNLQKKTYGACTLTDEPTPSSMRSSTLVAGPSLPLRAYVLYG